MTVQTPLYHLHQPSTPHRGEALAWVVALVVYVVSIAWLMPHVATPLEAVPAVPLAHALALAVVTALTAVVLWLEARRTQVRGYLLLAGTFSSVCVLLVAFTLAFPGAFLPAGPGGTPRAIFGGPSTSVALFLLWHLVITIGVPLSAVILDRDDVSGREPVLRHGILPGVLWGTLPALAVAVLWLAVPSAAPDVYAPPALSATGTFVVQLTCLLALAGLVVVVVVTRASSTLSRWLLAICVLNLGDSLLNLGALRYSVGWYAARALGFAALSALLVVLVVQLARIDRRTDRAATTDPLTGVRNRITFQDDLEREMARAEREGRLLALLVIDIDRFKAVNDDLGHATGDAVLVEVANRLQRCTRGGDLLVRMGGDEFVVLLVGIDSPEQAEKAAGRVVAMMRPPIVCGGVPVECPVSVGVALHPGAAASCDELLRHADRAMYAAKSAGGGRYHVDHPRSSGVVG
ncbi:MAG: sensor domain-containing diguanylate cyclase [Candidatus Nanopelagicales bacterium]